MDVDALSALERAYGGLVKPTRQRGNQHPSAAVRALRERHETLDAGRLQEQNLGPRREAGSAVIRAAIAEQEVLDSKRRDLKAKITTLRVQVRRGQF